METKFNFKSQICTSIEQSRRLLELGLKKETADCYWFYCDIAKEWKCTILSSTQVFKDYPTTVIPAWSLHGLWELLPKSFWYNNGLEKKYHPIIEYGFVNYVTECGMELFDFDCGYEVWGSMIVVIEWLIKKGYFPKEYLEE
jgi:hypothetical protein